jgi:hypothetical protein
LEESRFEFTGINCPIYCLFDCLADFGLTLEEGVRLALDFLAAGFFEALRLGGEALRLGGEALRLGVTFLD